MAFNGILVLLVAGSAAAAPSRLSPEPAMSQATAQHSSQGHLPSMAGSAVHAAEPRDLEASSNGTLPQGFFEASLAPCCVARLVCIKNPCNVVSVDLCAACICGTTLQ